MTAPKPKPEESQVDLSEFYKLSRPKKPACKVGFARVQLSRAEQGQLDGACATDKGIITANAIAEWLAKRGQTVSNSAVVAHRARTCTCYDD